MKAKTKTQISKQQKTRIAVAILLVVHDQSLKLNLACLGQVSQGESWAPALLVLPGNWWQFLCGAAGGQMVLAVSAGWFHCGLCGSFGSWFLIPGPTDLSVLGPLLFCISFQRPLSSFTKDDLFCYSSHVLPNILPKHPSLSLLGLRSQASKTQRL